MTLLTLESPFKAAQELHTHLKRSSPDGQLLPTISQLKDLLSKLEPRLMKSGFADCLLGWHIWMTCQESGFQPLFLQQPPDGVEERQSQIDFGRSSRLCPPGGIIFDLTRALGELDRLGEVNFVIIKTPACIAVWIIAFVDWCLGVKPLLKNSRITQSDIGGLVPHQKSKVLIEVFPNNPDVIEPTFLTFKKFGSLDKLLGESQISFKAQMPWTGMVKAPTFFGSRIQDLQVFYGILDVVDTLMVLVRDLSGRFRASDRTFARYTSRIFPESENLLRLLSRMTMDNVVRQSRPIVPSTKDTQSIWQDRSPGQVRRVAELYLMFLAMSLFENVHIDDDIDLYFETKWEGSCALTAPLRHVEAFMQGQLGLTRTLRFGLYEIDKMMLDLIGASVSSDKPLITSKKGQVMYYSFIETMRLEGWSTGARRIFSGALQYEGQTYGYARAESNTKISDVLDLTKVSSEDFSLEPYDAIKGFTEAGSTWLGSVQDEYLSLYYVPCLERDLSLDPKLFFEAFERLIFMPGCQPAGCPPSRSNNEILYCRTIAAALSLSKPQMFRVLSSFGKQAHSLFVKAAMAELPFRQGLPGSLKGFPTNDSLSISRGSSCLPCVCAAALEIVDAINVKGMRRIVVIID